MSVSSANSTKVERYNLKYDNMKAQLNEMDKKMERLIEDIKAVEDKLTTKANTLKSSYETKMTYYKKCMEECETKYKRESEDNSKKMNDKAENMKNELDKSRAYEETIKGNIKKLLFDAEKHGIDLETAE
jgi:archaellum component FlaC